MKGTVHVSNWKNKMMTYAADAYARLLIEAARDILLFSSMLRHLLSILPLDYFQSRAGIHQLIASSLASVLPRFMARFFLCVRIRGGAV